MKLSLNQAPVWPPLPTVQDKIEEYIKKVDTWTNMKILKGFDYEVGGVMYHFGYDLYDQSNFAQANSKAIMSLTIGRMTEEELIAKYGTLEDGSLNKEALPVALPDEWVQIWQGHIYENGIDNAIGLSFNVNEFLALSAAAGAHNESHLGMGWVIKTELRAAPTIEAVEAVAKKYDIEENYRLIMQQM